MDQPEFYELEAKYSTANDDLNSAPNDDGDTTETGPLSVDPQTFSAKQKSPKKYPKYQRKYCTEWEKDPQFKQWVEAVKGDNKKAYCRSCACELRAHKNDLSQHAKTRKHLKNMCKSVKTVNGSSSAIKIVGSSLQTAEKTTIYHLGEVVVYISEIKTSKLIIEGKTKKVFEIVDDPESVLVVSKDRITAGDGVKAHDMAGKAVISTSTTCGIFDYLNLVGIKTHFVKKYDDKSFIAKNCDMIPIEWVSRRYASGSFLKRNAGVKEGYKFCPLKLETFYKDDANHDPIWSYEQLLSAELVIGGRLIAKEEIDIMFKTTACIFEVLERAWSTLHCSLIDMKVEYGVTKSGELVLADVIDSDSWRLWPQGDKRLMVDKQVYRNLKEVTSEDLDRVKNNFKWVSEKVEEFNRASNAQVVVLMGSPTDVDHCQKIKKTCKKYGIPCELRVTSAHKGTDTTLQIISEYEGQERPTVVIAVAGRSNGLGPVTSANSAIPVINCPPLSADFGSKDLWSSLRLPSGVGCTTILSPEGAALFAAQIFGQTDHVVWARIRAQQLSTWSSLVESDKAMRLSD